MHVQSNSSKSPLLIQLKRRQFDPYNVLLPRFTLGRSRAAVVDNDGRCCGSCALPATEHSSLTYNWNGAIVLCYYYYYYYYKLALNVCCFYRPVEKRSSRDHTLFDLIRPAVSPNRPQRHRHIARPRPHHTVSIHTLATIPRSRRDGPSSRGDVVPTRSVYTTHNDQLAALLDPWPPGGETSNSVTKPWSKWDFQSTFVKITDEDGVILMPRIRSVPGWPSVSLLWTRPDSMYAIRELFQLNVRGARSARTCWTRVDPKPGGGLRRLFDGDASRCGWRTGRRHPWDTAVRLTTCMAEGQHVAGVLRRIVD